MAPANVKVFKNVHIFAFPLIVAMKCNRISLLALGEEVKTVHAQNACHIGIKPVWFFFLRMFTDTYHFDIREVKKEGAAVKLPLGKRIDESGFSCFFCFLCLCDHIISKLAMKLLVVVEFKLE